MIGLDATLAAFRDGGAVGTDFITESADHALYLAVEVINVGTLHLLEVFQLLGVAKLKLAFAPTERFLGVAAFLVGWWEDGLFLASPVVVEVRSLLAFWIPLALYGKVGSFHVFVGEGAGIGAGVCYYPTVHFNSKLNNPTFTHLTTFVRSSVFQSI